VLVFSGLLAVDTQRRKLTYFEGLGDTERVATIGALWLYLDTVNLFVALLDPTGERR
jgi:FtsH-binding integral membrane protein